MRAPFSFIKSSGAPPTLTSVSTAGGQLGDIDGGYTATLTGTNFTGATGVTFGGTSATSVAVVSSTSITCTVPAHATGAVSVVVTTPGGSNGANTAFTYFSPSQLTLTSWVRGNYGGAPWAGTASAGGSGSINYVTAGADPTLGTALNGHTPAAFNGTTQYLKNLSSLASMFHTPGGTTTTDAGTVLVLFYASSAVATGLPYTLPAIFSPSVGMDLGIVYANDGAHFVLYNAGYNEVIIPCATGGWHLAQLSWNGTTSFGRIDGGASSAIAVASTVDDNTLTLRIGANYNASAFFTGSIQEVITVASGMSTAQIDSVRSYINTRYGLAI